MLIIFYSNHVNDTILSVTAPHKLRYYSLKHRHETNGDRDGRQFLKPTRKRIIQGYFAHLLQGNFQHILIKNVDRLIQFLDIRI